MNDPNGLIQWKRQYHLFYQYNPNGAFHDNIHWGHAVSDDLVYWKDLPIALAPSPGGVDKDGCWSGCAVDNHGVPTLIYTGAFPQVVCIATSSDDLVTWQKYEGNPVIEAPHHSVRDHAGGHFRDPYVWKEGEYWNLLIGSKIEDVGGMLLLYRSPDLIEWEYLHPLMVGDLSRSDPFWTGTMWECPNVLDFGDTHALLISIQATPIDPLYVVYHTGTYRDYKFVPKEQDILVHGGYFYAPQVMRLDDGRYILFAWIKEGRSQRISEWAGWAGVASLPLVVSLTHNGRLRLEPARELQTLRSDHWSFSDYTFETNNKVSLGLLNGIQGDCLEILAEFEFEEQAEFGLRLRCSPDGQEQTRIVCKSAEGKIVIDREVSSVSPDVERAESQAPLELVPGEPLKMHIFVDRSVMDVFCNDGQTNLTSRIYPLRPDSLGIGLFVNSGNVQVKSLDIWSLKSIW
jgi:beta-fructofuranosidase